MTKPLRPIAKTKAAAAPFPDVAAAIAKVMKSVNHCITIAAKLERAPRGPQTTAVGYQLDTAIRGLDKAGIALADSTAFIVGLADLKSAFNGDPDPAEIEDKAEPTAAESP